MDIVFFIYGLAFFSLGLSITTKIKKDSQFSIAKHLWLLIIFSFTHSLLEWIDMWRIIHGDDNLIKVIRTWPLLISFIFLFEFGRRTLENCTQKLFILQPILIYPFILLFILGNIELSANRLLTLEITTRYALGFPGSLLTGIALMRYFRKEILPLCNSTRFMRFSMYAISLGFGIYSIATGLITPKSDAWLSIWLNQENFYQIFGFPVQLLRAACALSISLGMIKVLNIFSIEGEDRLIKAFATVDCSLNEVTRLEQELHKLTQTLAESEDRLNRAQAVAGVGSWYLDIRSENLIWSDETYRIFGIATESSLTLEKFVNTLYPEDRDLVLASWENALQGAPYDIEHRITANDEIKWVRERAEIRFNADHQPLDAIGTVQDITTRKEYELALTKSERRMFAVIDASPIPKALYDDQQNILYINPAAVRAFGYRIEEIPTLNDWWPKAYPNPEYREWVSNKWAELIARKRAGEISEPLEVRIYCKDGITRIFHADVAFLQDEDESLNLVTLIDITYQQNITNRLKTMFDVASDGIHILDQQGNIIEFNQSFARMLGYSNEETIRLNVTDWDALIPRENIIDTLKSIIHKPATFETKHRRKDGLIIDVEINAKGIELDGNIYLYASSRDIGERVRMQQELFNAKEQYKLLFTNSPDAYLIMEIERGLISDCNQAAEEMLRGTRTQILGLTPDQISPVIQPNGRTSIEAAAEKIVESLRDGKNRFEWVHRRLDGTDFWAEVTIALIVLAGRQVLFVAWRDISNTKRLEDEIRSAKERLEVAASAGVIGIWDLDIVQNHLLWDNAMYKLYGVGRENGDNTYELWINSIHPEDKSYVEMQIQEALQGGEQEKTFDFRIIWPDGSIHYLKSASRIFYDPNGKPLRAIGVNYDFTDQKNTEQALIEARMKSDAANKAKSTFLANMSHEIRTPMNAVIGLTQLLLETELTELQRDYLSKLNNAANSLLGILNDILDYSKIEVGKLNFEEINFELSEIIENISGLFKLAAEEKGIKLIFDIAPDIPPVLIGDPLRLKQIINNLFGNALKFTRQGSIQLVMKIEKQYGNMIDLQVSITDTGIGMTPDQIEKLFTAFEQADTSMTRKFGGTGLGLAITKQLVEMMQGNIRVTSIFGIGSTFIFTIPLKISNVLLRPLENVIHNQIDSIRGAKILLVEDNLINQLVACKILEKMGLTITVANNGREGFERTLSSRYDAILMDLQMPEMDGIEATQRIRTLPEYQDIPIIAMTAATMLADREASHSAGMNDFVSKPINVDELTNALLRWIPSRSKNIITPRLEKNPAAPFTIPGLNLVEAVLRMGQDWNLLRRAIQGFSQEFAHSATKMDAYITQGQWSDARRLAHTLKGMAKTIGANPLSQLSKQLEAELMIERSDSLPVFNNVLTQTLAAIAKNL